MPMTCSNHENPWILNTLIGLVLGVCLFLPVNPPGAWAIDSNSALFEKNQSAAPGEKEKNSQPLALPEETPNPSPGIFSTLARIFLALFLIVGLIILTVWGVKFVWEKQGWNNLSETGKPIKVLTSTYLAPRKAIHLIEVGKRLLVVGVGKDEMSCFDVIADPDEIESLRQAAQQGFPKIFSKIMNKHEAVQDEAEAKRIIAESNELVGGYVEKLKGITKNKKNPVRGKGEHS